MSDFEEIYIDESWFNLQFLTYIEIVFSQLNFVKFGILNTVL